MKPAELMIMACTDKSGQRVWAVQSTSQTRANGFPTFHLVTWDASKAAWSCPCQSRKPCIHMRFASEASRREQQQVDAAFDALNPYLTCYVCGGEAGIYRDCCKKVVCTPCFYAAHKETEPQYPDYDDSNPRRDELEVTMKAEPIIARCDTGKRLFREPLVERVREAM